MNQEEPKKDEKQTEPSAGASLKDATPRPAPVINEKPPEHPDTKETAKNAYETSDNAKPIKKETLRSRAWEWVKQDTKSTDWLIVLLTAVIAGTSYLQWREIHSGSTDTHDLVVAAGKQAEAAKSQSEQAEAQTKKMGESLKKTDNLIEEATEQAKATNRLADAARKSIQVAADTLHVSEKAYVTIGRSDGTVAEILWPKDEKDPAGLLVYFQNSGRLPARVNLGPDEKFIGLIPPSTVVQTDHEFEPMWRAWAKKAGGGGGGFSGTSTIAGDSSYGGILFEVPQKQLRRLIDEPLGAYFYTSGKYEYCDGFGIRVCRSFAIRYAHDPYNRFFLMWDDECMESDLQLRMTLVVKRNPPDWQYLNPCAIDREELTTPIKQLPQLPR